MEMSERNFEQQFEESLDEINGDIEVCGLTFSPSDILKKCDPVAYRQIMLDYADSLEIELI